MRADKKIYDSVHRFIRFNTLESALIDSLPFQRLHYIRQLGIAFLVYPGGTHTRFEHSLGVMELASRIFDQVSSKREIPDSAYWRQAVRLAALCHDLGHLPFSHAAEKEVLGDKGHELWSLRLIDSAYLAPIWDALQELYPGRPVVQDIKRLSSGDVTGRPPLERVMTQMITGDFFGADRIDYLLRDAQCTGVAYGLFDYHQLIEMLCALPSGNGGSSLELGIEENGLESCEALLLARHFMHRRVYCHAAVKAYTFHLTRVMKRRYAQIQDLDAYLSMTDNDILTALHRAAREPAHPDHQDAVCLLMRHRRFRAVEIGPDVTEAHILEKKRQRAIPDEALFWELSSPRAGKVGLDFPVLRRNGTLVHARTLSQIDIPEPPRGWLYIDPAYESFWHE
jgi:HD superfamily phosphohydrolase